MAGWASTPPTVRMSYAPRTKLSCDSSSCTVLNDDYVFVSSGLGANQRMPLADWRIIIGDEPMREDFLPLEPVAASSTPEPVAVSSTPAPAAATASTAVGTKWVWSATIQPLQNYCVAIQTKDGVLQVKKVSNHGGYGVELARKMFPTYGAWLATLSSEGSVAETLPQDILSDLQRRKKHSAEKLADGGSAEAIWDIMLNWQVRTKIMRTWSTNQHIKFAEEEIGRLRGQLQDITLQQDIANPSYRRKTTRRLERFLLRLRNAKEGAATQTPEQNEHRKAYMYDDNYKQRLYIHTSRGKLQIAYDISTQQIAVKVPDATQAWRFELMFVKTLLDLPFSIGTELHLSVSWRRKEIDLYASNRN